MICHIFLRPSSLSIVLLFFASQLLQYIHLPKHVVFICLLHLNCHSCPFSSRKIVISWCGVWLLIRHLFIQIKKWHTYTNKFPFRVLCVTHNSSFITMHRLGVVIKQLEFHTFYYSWTLISHYYCHRSNLMIQNSN